MIGLLICAAFSPPCVARVSSFVVEVTAARALVIGANSEPTFRANVMITRSVRYYPGCPYASTA